MNPAWMTEYRRVMFVGERLPGHVMLPGDLAAAAGCNGGRMVTIPYPGEILSYLDPREVTIVTGASPMIVRREFQGWHTHESVRVVRGYRMRTWASLMTEFSAAFQFPLYFGENIEAFIESLSEPDQEPIREPRVCVITEADLVLADEDPSQLRLFITCLQHARERWHRNPPEHVEGVVPELAIVIAPHDDSEAFREAWIGAGALLTEFRVLR